MTDDLTVIEVLAIHDDQIERYGGEAGVRDRGLLDAALFRPRSGYYADLIEEAAALWESLSQNHPFIDGNKRTGFAVMNMERSISRFWCHSSGAMAQAPCGRRCGQRPTVSRKSLIAFNARNRTWHHKARRR